MRRTLDKRLASSLARLALDGVVREYPNKPDHVLHDAADARSPRELHPAFYGCYDWHSAVHSHWTLVRIARLLPDLPEHGKIVEVLSGHFTSRNIAVEIDYASRPERASFERPYGWAWMFMLTLELWRWNWPNAVQWLQHLMPLAELFVQRLMQHLPRQMQPVRSGVHSNTAFALAAAYDYAREFGQRELLHEVNRAALHFFGADRDAPARWEPNGNDFFSPSLTEADLMRRVLDPGHFSRWLEGFLPGLGTAQPANLLEPATVPDRTDAQGVHLDGLNLSRAWCLRGIALALDVNDPRQAILRRSAQRQLEEGLRHTGSGDFLGDHWLGTFALHALTQGDAPVNPSS